MERISVIQWKNLCYRVAWTSIRNRLATCKKQSKRQDHPDGTWKRRGNGCGRNMKRQTEGLFCGKNLWFAFIAGNSFNLSSRGEAQRPFFSVRISVCKRIWLEIGTVEISGWKEMPSASRKIEKIDKIFSVRTSAWRSVRKQKRKRAEVTVLYGIVESTLKTSVLGEGGWRGSTREERWGHYFLRRKNLRIKEVLDKNIW